MAYNDTELINLIHEPESHWIERKESFSAKDKIYQTVCAFANDLCAAGKDGIIWIGVDDKGMVTGLDFPDELLLKIDQIRSEGKIQPLPSLTVRSLKIQDKHVVAIVVSPSSLPPVRYDGRIWVRLGASTQQGNAEDERQLNERRRTKAGRSFDSEAIPVASTDDLNLRYFEESYLPSVLAREVLEANGRTTDEKLVTSRMAIGLAPCFPTVAGILALAYSPQDWLAGAYVQYVRYAGNEHGGGVSDQAAMAGNLETVIRQTEEKLKATIQTPTSINGQDLEQRYPDYPLDALKQLFRNAILHRNYEGTNAPTRVYWFDDRIEIANPGGPFGVVTAANFGQPHIADYRNPTIAEVLSNLKFVQKFGFGIQNARSLLKANGNPPPEFALSANMVVVTIKKRML